jgi:hypothetical protein
MDVLVIDGLYQPAYLMADIPRPAEGVAKQPKRLNFTKEKHPSPKHAVDPRENG